MHDTFLNQNLYEGIACLCTENQINRIKNLTITVHTNSHICEQSLREYFSDQNSPLLDEQSEIIVNKGEVEPLTATIDHIDGETVACQPDYSHCSE